MDAQQLAPKVAALESRVATLEDEGKILKGEVKQILTEIRTAILSRDNPFDAESSLRGASGAGMGGSSLRVVAAQEPVAKIELVTPPPPPEPAPEPEPEPEPLLEEPAAPAAEPFKEPIMLRPQQAQIAPLPAPAEPERPQWSLLTIASLTAWAEEAMRRLGPQRFEILLDLCEAAGHVTHEARAALSRVSELDIAAPEQTPTTNETVVVLRQLDALLNDDYQDYAPLRARRQA